MGSLQIWNKNKLIECMASVPLFRDLNPLQLEKLRRSGRMSLYGRNQVLFNQGDIVEHLFLVLDGAVKKYRTSEYGDMAILRLLVPRDTFMEFHVYLNEPALLSAQMITKSTILAIPSSTIRELASSDVSFSRILLKAISKYYRDAMLKIDSILLQSPVEKIGRYLLTLWVGHANTYGPLKLPFKKSLIAQSLGMKPETFSRTLSEIKKFGVCMENDEITMQTPFSLCHFCGTGVALKCRNRGLPGCIERAY